MCGHVTAEMKEAFPELRRVRGHVLHRGKRYPHWWCQAEDGQIIDPTVNQFLPHPTPEQYEEHLDQDPEPTGKCYNCGEYTYDGASFCTDLCESSYRSYIENPRVFWGGEE